ncbi:MAG: DNA mismatch repair endonuclease MutL [Idiomarina sp.]|nr:DNA mismatch repair endonuclease MutL [Idiomarina sp.]
MPIQLLPTRLANQIAAGEVVERPASVVKELVENSLDAGATDILIDIEKGGSRRIRIRDNGAGIPKDELTLALSRHATSKIATLDDLEAIMSLGFRGEALASISSVSRLTLTSRTAEQDAAWQAFCEGRDMAVQLEPAAHPQGTTVDVEDLFFNTPARRKFMRTEKTEFGHIDEVVKRIALASPQVTFKLQHNQQSVRHYPAQRENADAAMRVGRIVGKRFTDEAIFLEHHHDPLGLSGWVSPPQVCRHQSDLQYFYVNGRMMRDRLLGHAVRQAYGDLLGDDRQPSFVLYLTLPAKDVDVNVHPAKHEVRFHQSRQVHDFVLSSLRDALSVGASQEPTSSHNYQPPDPSIYQVQQPVQQNMPQGVGGNRHPSGHNSGHTSGQSGGASYGSAPVNAAASSTYTNMMQFAPLTTEANGTQWQPIHVLDERWLVVARSAELGLVDLQQLVVCGTQHQLMQALEPGLAGQPLLLPTQIEYPKSATLLQQYQGHLSRLGVTLRRASGDRIAVLQVPAILRRTDIANTLPRLFEQLEQQPATVTIEERDDVLSWLASHGHTERLTGAKIQQLWQDFGDQLPVQVLDWQQALATASVTN